MVNGFLDSPFVDAEIHQIDRADDADYKCEAAMQLGFGGGSFPALVLRLTYPVTDECS